MACATRPIRAMPSCSDAPLDLRTARLPPLLASKKKSTMIMNLEMTSNRSSLPSNLVHHGRLTRRASTYHFLMLYLQELSVRQILFGLRDQQSVPYLWPSIPSCVVSWAPIPRWTSPCIMMFSPALIPLPSCRGESNIGLPEPMLACTLMHAPLSKRLELSALFRSMPLD